MAERRPRGRPRSARAEQAVVEATTALLFEHGFDALTADRIAREAGVSKATIYKWWSSKAAVAVHAFLGHVQAQVPDPDTGDVARDLAAPALAQLRLFRDTEVGRALRSLVAAAQSDPEVAEALRTHYLRPRRARAMAAIERGRERGQLRRDVDGEVVLDLIFGPIYYRLLMGHEPLEDSFVEVLIGAIVRGLGPRSDDRLPAG